MSDTEQIPNSKDKKTRVPEETVEQKIEFEEDVLEAINQEYSVLIAKVRAGNPSANMERIDRAFHLALHAHKEQLRNSGEPYIMHPIAVAQILADLNLDTESIVTALLHDTVEDTDISLSDIAAQFGLQTAKLVSGVTKLAKLDYQPDHIKQAENFRKLLIAISEDIRVLLVKLADRVHNMRTLHFVKDPDKRMKKARETMDVYAPLAERIGIHKFKNELQDLAFAELYPDVRQSIINRISFLRQKGVPLVKTIEEKIRNTLAEAEIDAEVYGREKTSFSIWKKMEHKNVTFEQLSDIIAFRILVKDIPACYQALGIIHTKYHTISNEFKDYISTPKGNGYKSLHTLIIGPKQRCIEIQIRTHDMHMVAELGVAAHWSYKQGIKEKIEGSQYHWVKELLNIMDNAASPEEFMEHSKLEMFYDQVFCFTPKGDLIALPRGSTTVDFAFAVHSKIGLSCVGAKVNGRIRPLSSTLENGDQVEIMRAKVPMASKAWESFVVTGKARVEIRRFLRAKQIEESVGLGRAILQKTLRQLKIEVSDETINALMIKMKRKSADELLSAIGHGIIKRDDIVEYLYPKAHAIPKGKSFGLPNFATRKKTAENNVPISIIGLTPGITVHFAKCCYPIPGDRIIGLNQENHRLDIHVAGCPSLEEYAHQEKDWVDVSWENNGDNVKIEPGHCVHIRVTMTHEIGSLSVVTSAIAKLHANIANLNMHAHTNGFATAIMDIQVRGLNHLNEMLIMLKTLSCVHEAERVKHSLNTSIA